MTYKELTGIHKINYEHAGYSSFLKHVHEDTPDLSLTMSNHFNLMDPHVPIIDTKVYATTAWHRVIHKEFDPRQLRPLFGRSPVKVINETLERTIQMVK